MTVKDQIKILNNKIRQNQADYDLYRQNAEISALSSGDLNKYEYLTNKDLGYKPDPIQKAKLEYSPLGQVFNKGLKTDEKQEGLLKKLKNIEDKTDEQLKTIKASKDNQSGIKFIGFDFKKCLSPKGLETYNEIVHKEKLIDYRYLDMKTSSKNEYDFGMFSPLKRFFKTIYYENMLITAVQREQIAFDEKLQKFKKYRPRTDANVSAKANILKNAENLYEEREMIINAFKDKLFPLASVNYYDEYKVSESEEPSEREDKDESKGEKIRK